jgi:hypothetical protein
MPHHNFDNILHATIIHKTKDAIDSHFFQCKETKEYNTMFLRGIEP